MSERPLKQARKGANLTLEAAIRLARELEPRFPLTTYQALVRIEREGTENYWVIKGLAAAYHTDMESLARFADPKKSNDLLQSA